MSPATNVQRSNHALIVDDEAEIRNLFRDIAEDACFSVSEAECSATFSAALEATTPSVIFLDLTMPETDGIELLHELASRKFEGPIILASGQDIRIVNTAQRLGRMLGLNMPTTLTKPVPLRSIYGILDAIRKESRAVTAHGIRSGIKNGEFHLHFQPKVTLVEGENYAITGAEALVRWNHPSLGPISPDQFIPLAEESGIICDLTTMVLDMAIAQMGVFQKEGLMIPISVNISPTDLTDLTLPDRIASCLEDHNVDPSRLVLEVTEQAAMSDVRAATEILTRLRIKNISVSLDDFGAGFSSLIEIYRMPLSELKIDQALVSDLDADPGARTVMKAIAALAGELGLPLCVEGIETEKTAEFLTSIGCRTGQGFYFSKPLPPELFKKFAHKYRMLHSMPQMPNKLFAIS